MKNIKYITALLFVLCTSILFAQKIEHNGKEYNIKGEKIFMNGVDVTSDLSPLEQNTLKAKLRIKLSDEKKAEALAKEKKKALQKQKKAEKKQKKAEKELKNKQKAQDNYESAQKKLEKAQSKYEKLKKKGKLSPEDEVKWLEKIEKLREKFYKKENKLKKS
tara:strand:+ start:214968 stop:215453 length:486 start_codon:yes stop_codon:yes gene_type:complete